MTSTRLSVFTPAGGVRGIRAMYGTAMTGTIPIPRDTIHTNVNARAFESERAAYTRSLQRPLSILNIEAHSTLQCKDSRVSLCLQASVKLPSLLQKFFLTRLYYLL